MVEPTHFSEEPSTLGLRRRLYGLGFVDEFGPLYALFTILFLDNGITASQVSTVFLLWAVVQVAFEVPSGALADLIDRRTLLAIAFVLRAVGITVWLVEPSYAGVLIGASLWSIHSSLASGAWEALIHDELTAVGQASSYARTMARIQQFSATGITLGALVATASIAAGATIEQLGWVTVAIHAVSILLVVQLPDVRWVAADDRAVQLGTDAIPGFDLWQVLRDGLRFAWRTPVALRLIGLGAVVEGLYIVDDYVPVLADERGASAATIPILVAVVFVGLILGDELVARQPLLSGKAVGFGMCLGALALATAVLATSVWPLLLVGFGYAAQEVISMIGDARFQEQIPSAMRATVTSVRSFFAGIVSIAAYGIVTVFSTSEVSVWALVGMAGVLFAVGLLATRWIPESTTTS